jgi:hypothetical protein
MVARFCCSGPVVRQSITAGSAWQSRTAHIMVGGKQTEKEEWSGPNISSKGMPQVTFILSTRNDL